MKRVLYTLVFSLLCTSCTKKILVSNDKVITKVQKDVTLGLDEPIIRITKVFFYPSRNRYIIEGIVENVTGRIKVEIIKGDGSIRPFRFTNKDGTFRYTISSKDKLRVDGPLYKEIFIKDSWWDESKN